MSPQTLLWGFKKTGRKWPGRTRRQSSFWRYGGTRRYRTMAHDESPAFYMITCKSDIKSFCLSLPLIWICSGPAVPGTLPSQRPHLHTDIREALSQRLLPQRRPVPHPHQTAQIKLSPVSRQHEVQKENLCFVSVLSSRHEDQYNRLHCLQLIWDRSGRFQVLRPAGTNPGQAAVDIFHRDTRLHRNIRGLQQWISDGNR